MMNLVRQGMKYSQNPLFENRENLLSWNGKEGKLSDDSQWEMWE